MRLTNKVHQHLKKALKVLQKLQRGKLQKQPPETSAYKTCLEMEVNLKLWKVGETKYSQRENKHKDDFRRFGAYYQRPGLDNPF